MSIETNEFDTEGIEWCISNCNAYVYSDDARAELVKILDAAEEAAVLRLRVAALEAALKRVYTTAMLEYVLTHEQAEHLESIVRPLLQPDTQRDAPDEQVAP